MNAPHRPSLLRFVIAGSASLMFALVANGQPPRIVRSTDGPAWGAPLRLVEEVRIGRLDGPDEHIFGSVEGVAVGREGDIFVADAQVPVIRKYDARGTFVRNVGRKGAGPGEYETLSGIRALPDGRIAIWDNGNQRITVYTAAGDLAESHRVSSGLHAADLFQVDRTGHFYVRTVTGRPVRGGTFDEGWIRVSPSGRILDTIAIPKEANPPRSFVLAGPSGYDRPFTRQLVTGMGANGSLLVGHTGTYAFEQRGRGVATLRIERPYRPVPVGRAERSEWEAWGLGFERNASRTGRPASFLIPETKPAFSELRTDSRGRIWVRRYVAAVSRPGPERKPGDDRPRRVWREPPTFDVFESEGRFLGTVALPFNASLHDAIDRHVWATVRGESDEEYVVRFRIEATNGR